MSDIYCPVPFMHISSTNDGNYRVCCFSETAIKKPDGSLFNIRVDSIEEVWNSDFYKKLREDFSNGVRNPVCETCWKQERNGVHSKRHQFIKDLEGNFTKGVTEDLPKFLDIKIGTLCNLKCITCYPGASSLHEEEANKWREQNIQVPGLVKMFDDRLKSLNIDIEEYNPKNINVDKVVENLDPALKQATEIRLVGGEPLVSPITKRIVEHCVENGYSKNLMIEIITNLTTLNPSLVSNLLKFKELKITVSYDHIEPEKFNYIRYPADYNHFKKNLESILSNKNIEVRLSTTWSIFNIFDLPEIFDCWEEMSRRYEDRFIVNFQYVIYPNYFNIQYLTQQQKNYLADRIEQYIEKNSNYKIFKENLDTFSIIKTIRNYMNTPVEDYDEVVKERTRVLDLYDATRKTDFRRLFPKRFH